MFMSRIFKKTKIGIAITLAAIACPCHLPLTIPFIITVTGGTIFGVSTGNLVVLVILVSLFLFTGGCYFAYHWSKTDQKEPACKISDSVMEDTDYTIRTRNNTSNI